MNYILTFCKRNLPAPASVFPSLRQGLAKIHSRAEALFSFFASFFKIIRQKKEDEHCHQRQKHHQHHQKHDYNHHNDQPVS